MNQTSFPILVSRTATFPHLKHAKGEYGLKGKEPVAEAVANVTRAFSSALDRSGIEDFKFHDLRHTFASHMIMRGASLKEVQEIRFHIATS